MFVFCLCVCGFWSHSIIFHNYEDATIVGEDLYSILMFNEHIMYIVLCDCHTAINLNRRRKFFQGWGGGGPKHKYEK